MYYFKLFKQTTTHWCFKNLPSRQSTIVSVNLFRVQTGARFLLAPKFLPIVQEVDGVLGKLRNALRIVIGLFQVRVLQQIFQIFLVHVEVSEEAARGPFVQFLPGQDRLFGGLGFVHFWGFLLGRGRLVLGVAADGVLDGFLRFLDS